MTRIVLLLTAFPLAAVLALLLDTLLDRRLAALRSAATRPAAGGSMRRVLWIALVAALGAAGAPAVAAESDPTEPDCARIDCSLVVDSALVDRLWRQTSGHRVKLVAQSRIPVAFDVARDDRDDAGETGEVADGDDRAVEPPAGAAPTTAGRG